MRTLAILTVLTCWGCAPDDGTMTEIDLPPEGSGGGDPSAPPPTASADLRAWLQDGNYRDWTPESGLHDSTGPHFGGVRTYVNDPLFASLEAGESEHPIDAAAVKELYGGGSDILGWSVLVKVSDSSFYWWEEFEGDVLAEGEDIGICVGCHSGGTDLVLTPFPLQ